MVPLCPHETGPEEDNNFCILCGIQLEPTEKCPKCGGTGGYATVYDEPYPAPGKKIWLCSSCLHEWPREE